MVKARINIVFFVILIFTALVNQPNSCSALEVGQQYDYSYFYHYIFEYKDFNSTDLEYTLVQSFRILDIEDDIVICKVFAVAFVLEHRMQIANKGNFMNFTDPKTEVLFTSNASGNLLWFWNTTLFEQYEDNLSTNSNVSEYEMFFEVAIDDFPYAYYYFDNNDTWLIEECKYNFSMSVKYDESGILEYHRFSIKTQGEDFNKTEYQDTSRIYLTVQTSYSISYFPMIFIITLSVKLIKKTKRRKKNEV